MVRQDRILREHCQLFTLNAISQHKVKGMIKAVYVPVVFCIPICFVPVRLVQRTQACPNYSTKGHVGAGFRPNHATVHKT